MATIPYQSNIDARTGRGGGARLRNAYDAEAMGAGVGRAMQQLGQAVGSVGETMMAERNQKEKEQAVYAEAMFDPTDALNEAKQQVDADATGYKDLVKETYINRVSEYVDAIDDDNVRVRVRDSLLSRLPNYVAQADAYEQKTRMDTTKQRTNDILNGSRNKVLADPSAYEDALMFGRESIELYGSNMTAAAREEMKTQWGYDLTKNRFQSMVTKAKSPQELDDIAGSMAGDEWRGKLMPRDFEDLTNTISSTKKAYQNKMSAEAKAAISNLTERSTDITTFIPQEEIAAAQQVVAASGDITEQQRLARVIRNQNIVSDSRKLTPSQLKSMIDQASQLPSSTRLNSEDATAINNAASKYGVSPSYLESLGARESGGKADATNPNSSAAGWGQFTEGTFLNLVKDPAAAIALGIKPGATKEEILALRNDKAKSIQATAILAKQNQAQMESALGRPISDAELYIGHFLGAAQGVRFLQTLQTNPEASAAAAFPTEADSNKNVFVKNGKELTVAEVYKNISNSFTSMTSRVTYDDNQVRQKILDKMEKELNGPDAIKFAADVGNVTLVPLDQPGAFAARATAQATAQNIYGRQFKPFTSDEEAYLTKIVDTGNVNDTLTLMRNIATAPAESAKSMFSQLKIKTPAFSHAGALALEGDAGTASDVVRGWKRITENPAVLTSMNYKVAQATVDFNSVVGKTLDNIDPAGKQAAQEAAVSLLVEKKKGAVYSSSDYKDAVNQVLRGRIDKVNGYKTFLPASVSANDLEKALSKMTLNDYIGLSPQGAVPQHAGGGGLDPDEIDEIKLQAVGDDKYKLLDSDNSFVWTGRIVNGRPEPYIIDLRADKVRGILNRKQVAEAE